MSTGYTSPARPAKQHPVTCVFGRVSSPSPIQVTQDSKDITHNLSSTRAKISTQIQQLEAKYEEHVRSLTEQLQKKSDEVGELRHSNVELEKQNYYLRRRLREYEGGREEQEGWFQRKGSKGKSGSICMGKCTKQSEESEKENQDSYNQKCRYRQK